MTQAPHHHTATILGSTVHYWEYNPGKKPTIFMVHGFRGTHDGLSRIIENLSEFHIVIPDLPGFGKSTPMDISHTISHYSQCMIELIKKTQLDHPVLLGHSMGATVVAHMVASQPDISPKMIAINPVAAQPKKGVGAVKLAPGIFYHWLAGKVLSEKVGMKILTNKQLFLIGSVAMTKTRDRQLRKWIHWNHMEYMGQFSSRAALLEAYVSSSAATVTDYVDKLDSPVLLIAGKKDAIAPIKTQRVLAKKLKNAQLIELDNVGHIVHYEKSAEAAEAITAFLREA